MELFERLSSGRRTKTKKSDEEAEEEEESLDVLKAGDIFPLHMQGPKLPKDFTFFFLFMFFPPHFHIFFISLSPPHHFLLHRVIVSFVVGAKAVARPKPRPGTSNIHVAILVKVRTY